MNAKTHLVAWALAATLGVAAGPAAAEEDLGWIQSVSSGAQTITIGTATGKDQEVYSVSAQTQLSGPEGALTLSQLPSLADGSNEDFVMVSYEASVNSNVLFWLTLNPPLDQ